MDFTFAGWWNSSIENGATVAVISVVFALLFVSASLILLRMKTFKHQLAYFSVLGVLVYLSSSAGFYFFEQCGSTAVPTELAPVEVDLSETVAEEPEAIIEEPMPITKPLAVKIPVAYVECYDNGSIFYESDTREGVEITENGYKFIETSTGKTRTVSLDCHIIEP